MVIFAIAMRKCILALASMLLLLVSCRSEVDTSGRIVTDAAEEVTETSAVLYGYADLPEDGAGVKFGIVYSKDKNPTADNGRAVTSAAREADGRFSCKATGMWMMTTYYYRAFIKENGRYRYGKTLSLTTKDFPAAAQEAVDLGLSVKWGSCNLGAATPYETGDYFAWGETTPKTDYSFNTYKWAQAEKFTKYNLTDGKLALDRSDDAVQVSMDGGWRMPTYHEFRELLGCPRVKTGRGNVEGFLITGPSGKSIFLPAGGVRVGTALDLEGGRGCYWTSVLQSPNSYYSWTGFMQSNLMVMSALSRTHGHSIRPVME